MHLIYMDDSKDDKLCGFSALAIPEERWQECLDRLIDMRRTLSKTEGIFFTKEFHATDFVAGRGNISKKAISKFRRARIFDYVLSSVTMLPDVQLFNAIAPKQQEERIFEWTMNRINTNMRKSGSRAIIISDEGKEYDKILRKIRRHNYIPSQYGAWHTGQFSMNIPADRIIDDIVYRKSEKSFFVQAVDFCAFSLLRKERPLQSRSKYGIDKSFYNLVPICVTQANRKDIHGIIR